MPTIWTKIPLLNRREIVQYAELMVIERVFGPVSLAPFIVINVCVGRIASLVGRADFWQIPHVFGKPALTTDRRGVVPIPFVKHIVTATEGIP